MKYVLDHFQSSTEELSEFVTSIVAAADILGTKGQSVSINWIFQNMHPRVQSHLLFSSKNATISELYCH
jgi:hypothetical protein